MRRQASEPLQKCNKSQKQLNKYEVKLKRINIPKVISNRIINKEYIVLEEDLVKNVIRKEC